MRSKIEITVLIVVIALLSTVFLNKAFAQTESRFETKMSFIVDGEINRENYVLVGYNSGNIEVQGDTIKAIKHLVAFIKQLQKENEECQHSLWKAVDYVNYVPEYCNVDKGDKISRIRAKKYKELMKAIDKQGYKSIKRK